MKDSKSKNVRSSKFAHFLVLTAIVGLVSSFILTIEKIQLLKDPKVQLSCNFNPVVSCGSVITSPQAEAFGFANPLIGLISFAVIITIGVGIIAGAKYKRWFWLGLQAGTIFGVLFAMWLFYQSLYIIKALCPFCIVVWAVVVAQFVYVTRYNIMENNIKVHRAWQGVAKWFTENAWFIVALWYLAIFVAILNKFWYYWKTLI